ncbi:MAG: response regulator transcription factor [Lawsonibacter sp.]|jgi:DNA-binding LytR/AlgR family response regulator|nr:response regulator transcription factor [Lawsonibacter sp.]MCI9368165.1 response regulator transcription factor [Oscillospiraceae bacterium]
MGYRLAVCDDEQSYSDYVADLAGRWAELAGTQVEVERFPSAEAFLFRYEERKDFDVLLLDIEMTGMDGVELAKRVRQESEDVQIVFITGYTDYIAEGYEVSALHYLTKPVNEEKLFQVLTKAVGRLARNERALTLELPGETVRIVLSRVRYMDVLHNYVTVHADRDYAVKRPLGELEKELDGRFFRVGRSCVLNLAYVQRVTRTEVELTSGERIALPRGQYEKLNRAIVQRM